MAEPPLNFKPTYKLDIDSDVYDTGSKQRIPAWADRVLFVPRGLSCIAYASDPTLRLSDHRPVYASFECDIQLNEGNHVYLSHQVAGRHASMVVNLNSHEFTAESQVCSIM